MNRLGTIVLIAFTATVPMLAAAAQAEDKKAGKVSEEMKAFMKMLDGTEKEVRAALQKYAAEGVDTSDMDGILVRDPAVTKTETKDGQVCYTMEVKTGILDRTYHVYWKDGKIQKLKQASIK